MPVKVTRTIQKYHPDFVRIFSTSAETTARRFLRVQCERMSQTLKDDILGQRRDWYPLSPKYLAQKVREGFDPRILIRTKQYVESIQVFEDPGVPVVFRVSVPEGDHNSGLPFAEIGRILEFGRRDGEKPYARPHWRPVWGLFIRDLPQVKLQFRAQILKDFRQALDQ